jgi:CTP-dependent riboflavin kinase
VVQFGIYLAGNGKISAMVLRGRVVSGCKEFTWRMSRFPSAFEQAVGHALHPGTINVKVDQCVPIVEEFRIRGTQIGEPDQDLLFERCRINGIAAVRIRPYHLESGTGGHGDDTLEISSACWIPSVGLGADVEIEFFREPATTTTNSA